MSNYTWPVGSPYIINKVVEPKHIDGLNHANNGVYVNWCEDAAWSHSGELGLTIEDYRNLDRAMAVKTANFEYLAPSLEGDELAVGTWLASRSGITLRREFAITRPKDNALILLGHWELVCIEISTGSPKRMPKEFVEIYGAAIQPPNLEK